MVVKAPHHTVEVKIFWFTKSRRWAYVGNPFLGISQSFKVNVEKLREIQN
jgi:hypothetical protein